MLKLLICRECGWGARCLPNCCRGRFGRCPRIQTDRELPGELYQLRLLEVAVAGAIGLVNEIGAAGIRGLRLTGGEPLLTKDLFQVLGTANTSPLKRIMLQTNGLPIKKLHREIDDSPITNVCVS